MTTPEALPKISVALCTYNGAHYLQEQLDSIATQTRQPFEIVVADDCSTDETVKLLESFAKRCSFPVRIHQNPTQLGSTGNFDQAIRRCQGDYIALSDQDDRWKPEKLCHLGELLDGNPAAGMVFSDATLIDSASQPTGGTLWQSLRFPPETRARFAHDPTKVLLARPVVTGATMLFRRALLERFASIPQNWVHDGWITWMSVLWSQALVLDEPLTDYRIHASQQLGVGDDSFLGHMTEIRRRQRNLYASIAQEFESLLRYVEQSPALDQQQYWQNEIARAAGFFKVRAEAPASFTKRLLFLARHLTAYQALAGPTWRILARDLFMGKPASR